MVHKASNKLLALVQRHGGQVEMKSFREADREVHSIVPALLDILHNTPFQAWRFRCLDQTRTVDSFVHFTPWQDMLVWDWPISNFVYHPHLGHDYYLGGLESISNLPVDISQTKNGSILHFPHVSFPHALYKINLLWNCFFFSQSNRHILCTYTTRHTGTLKKGARCSSNETSFCDLLVQ